MRQDGLHATLGNLHQQFGFEGQTEAQIVLLSRPRFEITIPGDPHRPLTG